MVADPPPAALICRVCKSVKFIVTHTRRTNRGTVRYRRCADCGTKHKTCERVECVLSAAKNAVRSRLDEAAGVAVGFLRNTDEDGISRPELFARVRSRVPGIRPDGFAFRLSKDRRVILGDDSRYRLRLPTA